MKDNLFIKTLLIIIVILLALNVLLPTLSNPTTSYAAKNIEYKVIDIEALDLRGPKTTQKIEIFFNELGKEGWEYTGNLGVYGEIMIFER